ncbi:Flp/Fap pilin component [Thioalkalivibrio nitratireducens DSM 14787]|uniref:Flp/Fap pilin component n=1 Tax=Thioalkalivibrio nitratireducens (strain DSM 14787 / UNIQEM 213 / ALEN2) TaxID=1255043 RepID=L0DYR7_THIND|nr:Flp family type IVb pilin [Thioalkalivibrio nitratireducens]AGA34147.1 Flp/Fap pilin component [Thioalkalivibrio nitratireducens DSM 14787]
MFKQAIIEFFRDDEGASGIEYALVAAMVALAIVAFVPQVRDAVTEIFTSIADTLSESVAE